MAHSRLARGQMFDWVERCLQDGKPTPGDSEIMARFGFESPESARTLLAEIADAGLITIKGYGDTRTITLGRARGTFTPAARPTPSVVSRSDAAVDRAVDKVRHILTGTATARKATIISKSPARPSQAGARSDGERPGVIPAPVAVAPQPKPTPRLTALRTQIATREERRQLNIHFPAADFDRIAARAAAAGQTTPHYARAAVITSLDKPTIPAAVTAAAIRHETPLCDFVRMLLAVGLAAFEHDLAPEIAA